MHTTQPAAFQSSRYAPKIWGHMPPRMKVLYVTTIERTGGWLAEAFAADSASDIHLEEAIGATDGLAQLRDQVVDAVLVSHEPGILDALDFIEGLRAGGNDEPMIILGSDPSADLSPLAYEVGADAYCCVAETTTRSLLWTFARAIERTQLLREHRRLVQMEQQRLAHEHLEAERLLAEQRALIAELELIRDGNQISPETACGLANEQEGSGFRVQEAHISELNPEPRTLNPPLPPRLVAHYREMLRAYVVMGAGNRRRRDLRSAHHATSRSSTRRLDRLPRQSKRPPRDDPRRSLGPGSHGPSGRRLPPPLP
jgi:DNA-binding NarL/FixJ family response regulator